MMSKDGFNIDASTAAEAPKSASRKQQEPLDRSPSASVFEGGGGGKAPDPLSATEIFKRIQPKACKIITKYGEGTGYFLNGEKGILISSFHLVGRVSSKLIQDLKTELAVILFSKGYLTLSPKGDASFSLTEKVSTLAHPRELNLKQVDCVKLCGLKLKHNGVDYDTPGKIFSWISGYVSSLPDTTDSQMFSWLKKAYFDREITLYDEISPIEIHMDGEVFLGEVYFPDQKKELILNFAQHDTALIKLTHLPDGRPFPNPALFFDFGSPIQELPEDTSLEVGESVYYAGYPLGHQECLFSKGMVSCVSDSAHKQKIVLEAPIAPGNSGGPVFVSRGDKLFFVGLISSEVAQVSEKIRIIKEKLASYSGPTMSMGGINVTKTHNVMSVELANTLLDNLSTGKGNVIRVRINDLITEFSEKELIQRLLFREPHQFFVPKRTKRKPEELLKLFEYMVSNNILRLHVSEILDFFRLYADNPSRMSVYGFCSNLQKNDYIDFSCYGEGTQPQEDKLSSDGDFVGMIKVNRSDRYSLSQAKIAMRRLYDAAVNLGIGRLRDGHYIHGSVGPEGDLDTHFIKRPSMLAEKFYGDHIGGQNKRENKKKADEVFIRRALTVSTTIPQTSETVLKSEVTSLQRFYSFVSRCMGEIAKRDGVIQGLYYLTLSTHQLQIRSSKPNIPTHVSSRFLYSTKQSSDKKHYMYHFAGINPKTDWKTFVPSEHASPPEGPATEVYYHH